MLLLIYFLKQFIHCAIYSYWNQKFFTNSVKNWLACIPMIMLIHSIALIIFQALTILGTENQWSVKQIKTFILKTNIF